VVFDAGAVDFPLVVRSRQRGDRIRPWGGEGSRKVGRLLIDAKIPRRDRPLVPLLVKDDRVLWVAGLQRSDAAPVGPATRQVLVVELLDAPAP
jgi:tRNA(Ile)-lysidine synthase